VARNFHGISQPNFVPALQANSNPLISYNQPQQDSSTFAQHGNILGSPLPIHPQTLCYTPVPQDLYPGLPQHAITHHERQATHHQQQSYAGVAG
jgi:hypothetical protein